MSQTPKFRGVTRLRTKKDHQFRIGKILINLKIIPFSIFSLQCSRPGMIYGIAICIFRRIQPKFQQKIANIMAFSSINVYLKKKNWAEMCFGSLHIMLNTHLGILNITQNTILQSMSCCFFHVSMITLKRPICYFHSSFDALDSLGWPRGRGAVNMLFSVMTHISSQSQFSQHPATQLPGPFSISSVQHQHLA